MNDLKSRVARVITAGVHAILDKIESSVPLSTLEQSIRDVDALVAEVRDELGKVAVNKHLAQKQHVLLNQEHHTISEGIQHAIKENRDDLAANAIDRQLDIEAQLPILETNLADLNMQEKELTGYLDALASKRKEMVHAVQNLRAAQASASQPTALGSTQGGHALHRKIEDIQTQFDDDYLRLTGQTVLDKQASMVQTQQLNELNDLVRKQQIAERLLKLKQ